MQTRASSCVNIRILPNSLSCSHQDIQSTQPHTFLEGSVSRNPFSENRPRTSLDTNHTKQAGDWARIDTPNSVLDIRKTFETYKRHPNVTWRQTKSVILAILEKKMGVGGEGVPSFKMTNFVVKFRLVSVQSFCRWLFKMSEDVSANAWTIISWKRQTNCTRDLKNR